MDRMQLAEAKTHFSELIERAQDGVSTTILKYGRPVAVITPVPAERARIRFGTMKGRIFYADDFDAPLSDEELRAFEGDA